MVQFFSPTLAGINRGRSSGRSPMYRSAATMSFAMADGDAAADRADVDVDAEPTRSGCDVAVELTGAPVLAGISEVLDPVAAVVNTSCIPVGLPSLTAT